MVLRGSISIFVRESHVLPDDPRSLEPAAHLTARPATRRGARRCRLGGADITSLSRPGPGIRHYRRFGSPSRAARTSGARGLPEEELCMAVGVDPGADG